MRVQILNNGRILKITDTSKKRNETLSTSLGFTKTHFFTRLSTRPLTAVQRPRTRMKTTEDSDGSDVYFRSSLQHVYIFNFTQNYIRTETGACWRWRCLAGTQRQIPQGASQSPLRHTCSPPALGVSARDGIHARLSQPEERSAEASPRTR